MARDYSNLIDGQCGFDVVGLLSFKSDEIMRNHVFGGFVGTYDEARARS